MIGYLFLDDRIIIHTIIDTIIIIIIINKW